jgi:MOSC domain-containing protein YiiM
MKLVSVQVGKPERIGVAGAADPMDREWETALFKQPVAGGVVARQLGLEGDGQADLRVHGGADRAINAYPKDHYAYWIATLGMDLPHGAFGENFTTQGMLENEVCLGDRYQVGGAVLEVSQPRQPCWKIARRWRVKDLAVQVERTGKTGWYFRVIDEGTVEPGAEIQLMERPHPEWTIELASQAMLGRRADPQRAASLARCPALSELWKSALASAHD